MKHLAAEIRRARIEELRVELAQLMREEAEAGLIDGAALIEECMCLVRADRKVEAVKIYRNRMELSLRESLDAINAFMLKAGMPITGIF